MQFWDPKKSQTQSINLQDYAILELEIVASYQLNSFHKQETDKFHFKKITHKLILQSNFFYRMSLLPGG